MGKLVEQIRDTARQLLGEGKVERVLGFEPGPTPVRSAPCIIRRADEVDRLTWDPFCGLNLAVFLHGSSVRTAIFAKGCDSRSIVNVLKERQLQRDNLVIVGVPCRGMVDPVKLERLAGGPEIEQARAEDDKIVVVAGGKTFEAPFEETLRDSCLECTAPTPAYHDVLLDGVARQPAAEATSHRNLPGEAAERWRHFAAEAARCIRCYACRNACPLCYCRECCVDQTGPRWIGAAPDPHNNQMFLLMRALHLAGRCVDCGACYDACPTRVDVRHLFKRMEREVRERFDYVPGRDPDEKPPLATFAMADLEDFITDVKPK